MTPNTSRKQEAAPAPAKDSLWNSVGDWNRFWFSPSDPTTVAFMRICCGVLLLYIHLSYSWGLLSYVGPGGWLDGQTIDELRHKEIILVPPADWGTKGVELPEKGRFIWSISSTFRTHFGSGRPPRHLASMLLFTLGLWTRITSVLAWAGSLCFIHRAPSLLFGLDTMSNIVLMYLMIAPCGDTLLWIAGWSAGGPGDEASRTAGRSVRFGELRHAVDASAFLHDLPLPRDFRSFLAQRGGTVRPLRSSFSNYNFAPMDTRLYSGAMTWLVQHRILWELFTAFGVVFTLIVEIGLPFLIWNRRTRWLIMCARSVAHFIGIFMGLVTFSLMMLVMLLSFIPPESSGNGLPPVETRAGGISTRSPATPGRRRRMNWC